MVTVPFLNWNQAVLLSLCPFVIICICSMLVTENLTLMFTENCSTELNIKFISSMLVISVKISLIETTSPTKSIFGFNDAVLKTLTEVTFQGLLKCLKKFLIIVDEWIVKS